MKYPKKVQYISLGKTFVRKHFRKAIQEINPDLFLYIPGPSGTIATFLRLFVIRRLIVSSGTSVNALFLQSRRHNYFIRHIIRYLQPDILFTISKSNTCYLKSIGCNAIQLPLGVDVAKYFPATLDKKLILRKKYGLPALRFLYLHIGHIKNERQLLELAANVPSAASLIVIGSTSTDQDLLIKRRLEEKGVCVFNTYLESIEELYQAVDCYIFHVSNIGAAIEIPLSVLEAMATNLPVITTKYGGLPSMFDLNVKGLYFIDRIDEISSLLNKITSQQLSVKTREAVLQYGWNTIVEKLFTSIDSAR
jgi:glycosyltransferase involved in cell wall biosynthesis